MSDVKQIGEYSETDDRCIEWWLDGYGNINIATVQYEDDNRIRTGVTLVLKPAQVRSLAKQLTIEADKADPADYSIPPGGGLSEAQIRHINK